MIWSPEGHLHNLEAAIRPYKGQLVGRPPKGVAAAPQQAVTQGLPPLACWGGQVRGDCIAKGQQGG